MLVHSVTRPSEFVTALKTGGVVIEETEVGVGESRRSDTFMPGAGLPDTVSRTWQVMKGRFDCAISSSDVSALELAWD